ncbi:MAG: rhodanese-like domain-containing protein [Candidatus Eisenbacteria bacterium]|nr:rhodanese-like domain-containing protein [Candidatus Eisenbacteria bacterium]
MVRCAARSRRQLAFWTVSLVLLACGQSTPDSGGGATGPAVTVSGKLDAGLRVLAFDPSAKDQRFTIYRGDYVRPELTTGEPFTLEIPDLDVSRRFPASPGEPGYFKVPDTGSFSFRIGDATGTIEAIEYAASQYREVGAKEAARMIEAAHPLVLDVRSKGEFASGHLEGAVLIPVQELHARIAELTPRKQEPVLVYCATGNRSTVASKMLVDAGFTRVVNMRRGIAEWNREGLPTVK